jgi:RNase P/RNase MRP subunit POP5
LYLTSVLNEVGFFLEILGNPKISELKNSIWVKLGKSLGDLGEADPIFRLKLVMFFFHT